MLPHGRTNDKFNSFTFPTVQHGCIVETQTLWVERAFFSNQGMTTQLTAVNQKPWGQIVPDCLIKGHPLTTLINEEVPYSIWFWAEYTAVIENQE